MSKWGRYDADHEGRRLSHFGEHDAAEAPDVALLQNLLQQVPQVLVRLHPLHDHIHVHQISASSPGEHAFGRSGRERTAWTAMCVYQEQTEEERD